MPKKRRGHWCWSCDRIRANEKFSGRGHGRHICRDCQKLPAEELAYRQNLRNLERCVTLEGIIPRKARKRFNQFLNHDDHRIRDIARQMVAEDQMHRQLQRILAGEVECDNSTRFDDVEF